MEKSKKKFKWWILVLCTVLLAVILFLAVCFAPFLKHRGKLGPHVYYAFNQDTGTVLIYGRGWTDFFEIRLQPPCGGILFDPSPLIQESAESPILTVVVLPGVTGLECGVLRDCYELQTVYLPDTLEYFDMSAVCRPDTDDIEHPVNHVTIYFDGDAPRTYEDKNLYPGMKETFDTHPLFVDAYDVTVVHRPDAKGWDEVPWCNHDYDEEYAFPLEARDFSIDWLSLLR